MIHTLVRMCLLSCLPFQVVSVRERLVMSMFPCACVRELWLLLRFSLDRLADGSNSKVQRAVWWGGGEGVWEEGVRECGGEGVRECGRRG